VCKKLIRVFPLAALAILSFAAELGQTFGQETGPLPVEDILRMRTPVDTSPLTFSPDRQWLAYTVHGNTREFPANGSRYFDTGVPTGNQEAEISIVNISDERQEIAVRVGAGWLPTWSPDGRYLAFLSTRDGSGQAKLWVWNSEVKRSSKASDRPIRSAQIEWMPDSRKLLIGAAPEDIATYDGTKNVNSPVSDLKSSVPEISGSTVKLYVAHPDEESDKGRIVSDAWGLDSHLRDLVLVNVSSGLVDVLARNQRVSFFRIFPDGARAAFSSPQQFEAAGSQQILYNLVVVGLLTGKQELVASKVRLDLAGRFGVSPDGSKLSYRAGGAAERDKNIWVVSTGGGTPTNLTHFETRDRGVAELASSDSSAALWDPGGEYVYFLHEGDLWRTASRSGATSKISHIEGREIRQLVSASGTTLWLDPKVDSTTVLAHDDSEKQDGFYTVNLANGGSKKILERGECYTCVRAAEGRHVVVGKDGQSFAYYAQDAKHPPEIWLLDPIVPNASRVTDLNPKLRKREMGSVRIIDWLDDDGERLRGALLLPVGYEAGRRYPLIVLVYGGQAISNQANRFGGFEIGTPCFNVQLLATRGYAVLMPDAPQKLGTPMLDLAKAILPGVNKVIDMGIADASKLGVMGHSYGGYSTIALITQTARFKAAIEAAGFADLVGTYGEMDSDGTAFGASIGETGQARLGGTPWQVRDRYIENSPFFYLDRIHTPLLILHGSEDSAVAAFLGDELFVALRRLGKSVEYARYRGEPHWISGYANQVDTCNRVISWLDKYVKQTRE
jgi:dipeptidyl aminopeptidase/acylaminoacyl peptidase